MLMWLRVALAHDGFDVKADKVQNKNVLGHYKRKGKRYTVIVSEVSKIHYYPLS